jgi:hypothetical protein
VLALGLVPAWALLSGAGQAAAPSTSGHQMAVLRSLFERLEAKSSELPVHVESEDARGRLRGEVYSIVEQRFDTVREALTLPASWCELAPLQFNVKSCTYGKRGRHTWLALYLGRKFFQEPEATHRLELSFEVPHSGRDDLEITLRGKKGPLGTRNHHFALAAVPLAGERTLIHLGYSYEYGLVSRAAMFACAACKG